MNARKNPIYVVKNKGQDVVPAKNWVDAFIEKFNMAPLIKIWWQFFEFLMSQINSYAWFAAAKEAFDQTLSKVEFVVAQIEKSTGVKFT